MRTTRFPRGSWRLAGSFALGLGLLVLGLLALLSLGLALPARGADAQHSAAAHQHDEDHSSWNERGRREGKPFHWSGRVARGKTVDVSGINGSIQVRPASGNQVVVDAKRSARKSDPESVEIGVEERDGNLTICARYPGSDGRLKECGDRQDIRKNDVAVAFEVQIPAGVNLVVTTVNGKIEAEDLHSDVEAATVNGSVSVSTTGIASAQTVNGSVVAKLGRLDDDLEFRTVNGRVLVELPSNVHAAVVARTMHGSISTDFPLSVKGRWGDRRMTGNIGRGGPEVRLETMNGAIELRSVEGRILERVRELGRDEHAHEHQHEDDGEDDDKDEDDDDDDSEEEEDDEEENRRRSR
jgi:hypothetical protein